MKSVRNGLVVCLIYVTPKQSYRFPFAKYPAVRIALLFAAGIVWANYVSVSIVWWTVTLAAILIIFLATEMALRKTMKVSCFYVASCCYLLAIIIFGALWFSFFDTEQQPSSAKLLSVYTWQQAVFKGTVQQVDPTSTGNYMIDVSVETTIIQDSLKWDEEYTLRTYYDPVDSSLPIALKPGAEITFQATIYPLEKINNPGEFKYKQYLSSQQIYAHAGIDTIYAVQNHENRLNWNWLQQNVLQQIEQNFNKETAALAKSLLIGYKNELDRETKTAFSRVGLAHIMAVSGMNVVYILAPFWLIIPFLWTFKTGKQLALAMMIIILVLFAGLTGFSASVMRACIMGGFITYGRIFNKARNSKNLTAVAAIIILLIHPANLFDIGFQLSFAAVYIILLILPVLQRTIPDGIQHRWFGIPVMAAIITLVVQLGLYPILSYYFHEFSLIAPLANAIVVPFLAILVPYALLLLPVAWLIPSVGFMLNAPNRWFLEFLQWFTSNLSEWQWSWIQTPETSLILFLIWLAAFCFIAVIRIPEIRWKFASLLLILLCLQQVSSIYQKFQTPRLKVTMLDVGQGDAVFVSTPGGRHFLIDAGRWSPGFSSGEEVILPFLKSQQIEKLDAVFLSHPHADHIGGIPALIGNIPIDVIYNSGFKYDSNLFKTYLDEAGQLDIPVKTLQAGDIISLDTSVRLFIYGPASANHSTDPNEHSLILELIYGKTQFLFTGDAGASQERRLIQNYPALIDTDFLKVGHHGSKTSSSTAFLNVVTPNIAAVSLALNNRFNHPHAQAVHRLKQTGTELYYTSLNGALRFVSDGSAIEQTAWR